ncbi:developmental pluripotency-associated 5 protein [Notamacropus eugenii]|uniref:developmental pluripotency-associated 5 protein n=1 Tax=Notamacropus eugenii TaxID=9315 RepID=UPI003B6799F6
MQIIWIMLADFIFFRNQPAVDLGFGSLNLCLLPNRLNERLRSPSAHPLLPVTPLQFCHTEARGRTEQRAWACPPEWHWIPKPDGGGGDGVGVGEEKLRPQRLKREAIGRFRIGSGQCRAVREGAGLLPVPLKLDLSSLKPRLCSAAGLPHLPRDGTMSHPLVRDDYSQSRPRRPRPRPQEKGPLRFLVEARLVGALIGMKGSRIRAMETLSGAQIKIDLFAQEEDGEKPEKAEVQVFGSSHCRLRAKELVECIIRWYPPASPSEAADEAQKAVAQMSIQEKK